MNFHIETAPHSLMLLQVLANASQIHDRKAAVGVQKQQHITRRPCCSGIHLR
jgi:hypothetical protein